MLKALIPSVAALSLLVAVPAAQAMPVGGIDVTAQPQITLVWGGCGPYGHRGFYGHCRPGGQWSGGGIWQPGWRVCPPGYHLGPYRRACWPN